jgi:drug/metabolite transporter (DMT)-like permease
MAAIWGLAAAIAFGIGDLAAREAGQREGSLKTLFYVQLFGSPLALIFVIFGGGFPSVNLITKTAPVGLLACLTLTLGSILLYRSLVIGPLLIVAPITSSFAAVAVALSLVSGERLTALQSVGILVTISGVAVSSIATNELSSELPAVPQDRPASLISSGIAAAIGAALLFGLGMWLLKFTVAGFGSQFPLLLLRVLAVTIVLFIYLATRQSIGLPSRLSIRWLLAATILDTFANWFLNVGLSIGLASIVTVIVSLYSVVTIVLGLLLLGERVTGVQQLGIVFTLLGVALVSI